MSRLAVLFAFLALVAQGQAQIFSRGAPASVVSPEPDGRQHGVPASVVSPEPDGRLHGVPASVLSPTPLPPGVNPPPPPFGFGLPFNGHRPLRRFGTGHGHDKFVFVPVPLFYPIYPDAAYPVADPSVPAPASSDAESAAGQSYAASAQSSDASASAVSDDQLRAAYLQGARDALTQQRDELRYGSHYLDSREQHATSPSESRAARRAQREESSVSDPPAKESNWPATVFVFKDGHQVETRNFAIMGQTLYDFSSKILKKIELTDLDKQATIKANDDRGIQVKLP